MSKPSLKTLTGPSMIIDEGSRYQGPTLQSVQANVKVIHDPLSALVALFPEITAHQYADIITISDPNGTPLFDPRNMGNMVEIIALIYQFGLDAAIGEMRRLSDINDDMIWYLPSMEDVKKQFDHEYDLSTKKIQGTSFRGNCKARGCVSTQFSALEVQTRGWDEPATTIVTCLECNKVFTA